MYTTIQMLCQLEVEISYGEENISRSWLLRKHILKMILTIYYCPNSTFGIVTSTFKVMKIICLKIHITLFVRHVRASNYELKSMCLFDGIEYIYMSKCYRPTKFASQTRTSFVILFSNTAVYRVANVRCPFTAMNSWMSRIQGLAIV